MGTPDAPSGRLNALLRRGLDLVAILAVVAALELVVARLAVPLLKDPRAKTVPTWHHVLDVIGLYLSQLVSTLGLGVVGWKVVNLARDREHPIGARVTVTLAAVAFLALTGWTVTMNPPGSMTLHIETSFLAILLLVGVALALRSADPWVKVGYLVLLIPFVIHYVGTFTLQVLMDGQAAKESPLPDEIASIGYFAVAAAALAAPICFAPRPLISSFLRPSPLILGTLFGTLAAVVIRRRGDLGADIAKRGFGLHLSPVAPLSYIAAGVVATAVVAWTLTAAITAPSPARVRIGIGYGLVVIGGYAFSWPLQLLCIVAGALTIAEAASRVRAEEAGAGSDLPALTRAVIPDAVWDRYTAALAEALHGKLQAAATADGTERSTIAAEHHGEPVTVELVRSHRGLARVDVSFGASEGESEEPLVTLQSLADDGAAAHPAPPYLHAPPQKTGDEAFDRRFLLHDAAGIAPLLLDDDLRVRAAAALRGWVAMWPTALHSRVFPGLGAPTDDLVPISDLAQGKDGDPSPLVQVVALLGELFARAKGREIATVPGTGPGPVLEVFHLRGNRSTALLGYLPALLLTLGGLAVSLLLDPPRPLIGFLSSGAAAVVVVATRVLSRRDVMAIAVHRGGLIVARGDGTTFFPYTQVADVVDGFTGVRDLSASLAITFTSAPAISLLVAHEGRDTLERLHRLVMSGRAAA